MISTNILTTLGSFGIGAASMYWADPSRGHGRRAKAFDQIAAVGRHAAAVSRVTCKDLGNRMRGLGAGVRAATGQGISARSAIGNMLSTLGFLSKREDGSFTVRKTWPPTTRLAVGAAGTVLVAASINRRAIVLPLLLGLTSAAAVAGWFGESLRYRQAATR